MQGCKLVVDLQSIACSGLQAWWNHSRECGGWAPGGPPGNPGNIDGGMGYFGGGGSCLRTHVAHNAASDHTAPHHAAVSTQVSGHRTRH